MAFPATGSRMVATAAFLALCFSVFSPISAALPTNSTAEQFLQAHNKARALVGASPLIWRMELAAYATKLASDQQQAGRDTASCPLSSEAASGKYGANQAVGNFKQSPAAIVGSWLEGRQFYRNNTCAAGFETACDAYKQVLRGETTELGCGSAHCGKDGALTICLYCPLGNENCDSPLE